MWGLPVYPPPAFFWWWYFFDAYARRIFWEEAAIAASGVLISIAVAITMRDRLNLSLPVEMIGRIGGWFILAIRQNIASGRISAKPGN
ncbi:hypothetical protein [Roseinatronobacter bogoriensis]|uniref:hypothetical protein n=1 Tax=Roseinatronobacter bogoriensis TaxID=119542 RepID=UPI0008F8E5A3|nr:hypothetical protein [Rhodobaca bogoriensis]MBB4209247.1 type IV secretory pathway TraG/TraD family ATPase VirD4 [Rhodobaca bogoriensis DSM 18756]TDW36227.1 hypothetical protein LY39_02773 [Rhodobaca barguzinensis]TDY67645.1 hypothetical protein EV660_107158 [Rhodobaca bogoriensis DSM 18756]